MRGIIERQGKALDWDYLHRELPVLAELSEKSDLVDRLEAVREDVEPGE